MIRVSRINHSEKFVLIQLFFSFPFLSKNLLITRRPVNVLKEVEIVLKSTHKTNLSYWKLLFKYAVKRCLKTAFAIIAQPSLLKIWLRVKSLSSYSKLEMILNSTQKLYAISLTANCVNCVVFVHKLVRLYLKYKL